MANRKMKGLICACVCACTCMHACVHLPKGAVVLCMKGDDAAIGRSGEWSTAVVAVMRLSVLPGYCSHIIHSGEGRSIRGSGVAEH